MHSPTPRRPTGLMLWFHRSAPFFDAARTLKWMLGFAALLILLPLASLRSATLETAFGDQGWLSVLVATLALVFAAWGAMLCSSLRIAAERSRASLKGELRTDLAFLSRWLDLPLTRFQRRLLHLIALPGIVILVVCSRTPLVAALAAIAAVGFANVVGALLELTTLDASRVGLLPGRIHRLIAPLVRPALLAVFERARRVVSAVIARIGIQDILDDANPPRIQCEHFLVICTATLTFLVLFAIALVKQPPFAPDWVLSSPFLLFTVLALLIWTIGAFEFHLPRYGISPLATIVIVVVTAGALGLFVDHSVESRVSSADQANWPTPVEVVARSKRPENLVVICSTGGGIFAAGWTTFVLDRLLASGAVVGDEIRLLSTVSGGSVGATFAVLDWDSARKTPLGSAPLDKAFQGATTASLPAVLYGMVFTDLARTITAGLSTHVLGKSRGEYLDAQWERNAAEVQLGSEAPWLGDLAPRIRAGELPAVIFNATVMETGRRVMITPLRFDTTAGTSPPRAQTMTEYLLGFDSNRGADQLAWQGERVALAKQESAAVAAAAVEVDLRLWSAARLSATFPYLTPAARVELQGAYPAASGRNAARHHFIDGGYYDNYGVASALDFLEPVMDAFERGEEDLGFSRIAIIEIRAFRTRDPAFAKPSGSFVSEVIGPVHGVTNIRDGAAFSRNEIELARFIDRYSTARQDTPRSRAPGNERSVEIRSFVFEPTDPDDGPLSWSMTRRQVDALRANWTDDGATTGKRAAELREFLGH